MGAIISQKTSKTEKELFRGVKDRLINHFSPGELMSILAYGNRINNRELVDRHSDYDITIIFKNYPSKNLPSFPAEINITTLFWPDIELCGVKNFRLYNHGEFYVIILSEAKTLYGINPFKKLKKNLPQHNIVNSLKEQVLLHCSKLAAITLEPESLIKQRNIRKYSFRVAQNLYFFKTKKVNCKEFYNKPYRDWISILEKNNIAKSVINYLKNILKIRKSIENIDVFKYIYSVKKELFKIYE